jgi:hypothetical protein
MIVTSGGRPFAFIGRIALLGESRREGHPRLFSPMSSQESAPSSGTGAG